MATLPMTDPAAAAEELARATGLGLTGVMTCGRVGDAANLAPATFVWGWHLEAGTAALRLMTSGVLDRHLDLELILGHWGELLLFWHQHANSLARIAGLDRSITEYLRQKRAGLNFPLSPPSPASVSRACARAPGATS